MEKIGKRLRALREGVRLTQVNMAEILGVQQSRINRYETGQSTPSPEIFIKYADYFDVSMDYLYCRTDEPRGKLYDYQPQVLREKTEQNREMREFIEMCGFVPFLEHIFFKTACMYQQDSARTGKSGMWRSTWRFSLHRGNILNMNCAWSC